LCLNEDRLPNGWQQVRRSDTEIPLVQTGLQDL